MRTPTRLTLLAVLAVGASMLAPALTSSASAATTLVVDDTMECPGAVYSSIGAAVADASPGDTIQVCAGIYPETVNVDKTLTFLGAQAGVDGRHGRGNLTHESVVLSLNGDFVIGGVDGVTIDGFTLRGAGSDAVTADAIEAFQGGSGYTFTNNVIRDNELGINLQNPDGSQPTVISRNAFIDNSVGTTGDGGTAVFISNGPANSTTIQHNTFTGHRETAINFAGAAGDPSRGLVVADNKSTDDSTFVVATNSTNALIDNNTVLYNGSDNGSGILDFGSNTGLRISYNTLTGGDNANTTGIRIGNFTGAASIGTTVVHNKVTGRYNGVRASGNYTSLYVANNLVKSSVGVGVLIDSSSTGNLFVRNKVRASAVHDCEDDSTGSLTAGTGNTWRLNSGNSGNSTPAGICPS